MRSSTSTRTPTGTWNCAEEQLTNPANERPDTFDISPGSTLLGLLERSDPAYQPTEWDDRWASDGYAEYVEAWSRMRYVVVTRAFDIHQGSTTLTTFTGGSMRVEAVIADLRSHAILCTASAKALKGTAADLLGGRLNSLGHGSFDLGSIRGHQGYFFRCQILLAD